MLYVEWALCESLGLGNNLVSHRNDYILGTVELCLLEEGTNRANRESEGISCSFVVARSDQVAKSSDYYLIYCEGDRTWVNLILRQHAKRSCRIRIRINGLREM